MNTLGVGFVDTSVQFLDNLGVALAGGSVEFFLAGTTTHVATYSDQALSAANTNPVLLDGSGRASIYFDGVNAGTQGISIRYTLRDSVGAIIRTVDHVTLPVAVAGGNLTNAVLGYGASTTLSVAGNTITPTLNRHMVLPEGGSADQLDTIAVTGLPDGAVLILGNSTGASAPLTVRSAIGNLTLTGGVAAVLSDPSDRITLIRQGTNFVELSRAITAGSQVVAAGVQSTTTQGRLTLASTVPIRSIDVTGSTLYFTPFHGNVIALPPASGLQFTLVAFSQVSIAIPAVPNACYDVFGFNNAGVLALELLAWTNLNARAGTFTTLAGVLVSGADQTRKYLGTIATGATGVGEDTYQHRYVWNYYNRVQRPLKRQETTDSWVYSTASWRQANGNAANEVGMVVGFIEDPFHLAVYGFAQATATLANIAVGIGHNTTGAITSLAETIPGGAVAGQYISPISVLHAFPDLGRDTWNWLEYGNPAGTTWFGDAGNPPPGGQIQTGMCGWTWG